MAVCGCIVTSCNEKPKNYRFVKIMPDGKEVVEDISAVNDTDALRQYMTAMEQAVLATIDKPGEQHKAMFVISPDGDTLNTDNELMEAAMKGQPGVITMEDTTKKELTDDEILRFIMMNNSDHHDH